MAASLVPLYSSKAAICASMAALFLPICSALAATSAFKVVMLLCKATSAAANFSNVASVVVLNCSKVWILPEISASFSSIAAIPALSASCNSALTFSNSAFAAAIAASCAARAAFEASSFAAAISLCKPLCADCKLLIELSTAVILALRPF